MAMTRRRKTRLAPTGFFNIQNQTQRISGFGSGDFVRLKDEQGELWRGTAELLDDNTIFYRFRNSAGRVISGASDGYGIRLRDERGQVWRGYVF